MTDERLPWFPCYASKLLGALAGMKAPEGYVYTVVLLRIYESGGECRDTLEALAIRTRLNKRVVSQALDSLFRAGRLGRAGAGITNPVATSVITDANALREKRKHASAGAASSRWEKAKQNQQNGDANRNADAMPIDAHLHLHTQLQEESLFSKENSVSAAKPQPTAPSVKNGRREANCCQATGPPSHRTTRRGSN
jgi:hypothetical protein